MTRKFPLNTWGTVVGEPEDPLGVIAVRVEQVGQGGGFLIIQREPRGTFDNWYESEEDVVRWLSDYQIEWLEGSD